MLGVPPPEPVSQVVARVILERNRRVWSQRDAAKAGATSNQTWSRFEKDGIVTDGARAAVMRAFDWPASWPEELPPIPLSDSESDELWRVLEQLADVVGFLVDHQKIDRRRLPGGGVPGRRRTSGG